MRSVRWWTSRARARKVCCSRTGARFGGHALYIKDDRLHYVNNFVGMMEQKVDASEDVPTGENLILSASFEKDGEDPPGVATGILSLYHGDKKVGEGRIKTQPGFFSLAGEGLCVGRDSGEAVTDDYPGDAVPIHGRDDQASGGRRQRRALSRPRAPGGGNARSRVARQRVLNSGSEPHARGRIADPGGEWRDHRVRVPADAPQGIRGVRALEL